MTLTLNSNTDDMPQPIAPSDLTDHPLADGLRKVYWDIEHIIGFEGDINEELVRKLMAIRDRAGMCLIGTPAAVTPLMQQVIPLLHAAIVLLEDGNPEEACDVLLALEKLLAPSPALASKYVTG